MTDSYEPHPDAAATMLKTALDRLGLSIDDAARTTAATEFGKAIRIDPVAGHAFAVDAAGNPRIVVENGRAIDTGTAGVEELIRELAAKHGATKAPAAPASSSTFQHLTERMIQRRARETGDLRRQAEALAKGSNPWAPNSTNLTARMMISRHSPELAERLKREAGITS